MSEVRTKMVTAQAEVARALDALARLADTANSMEAELNRLKETWAVANLSVIIRRLTD